MKVGINIYFHYSFFSSGLPSTVFSIANAIKHAGHTPVLVNLNGTNEWFEDVPDLKGLYEVRHLCQPGEMLDILIDVDGFIQPSERRKTANKVVVFLRKPAFMTLFESTVYPIKQPIQSFDCDEVWTWDHFGTKDTHLIEVLTKKPVRRLPYTWDSKPVEFHGKNYPSWLETSKKSELWEVHCIETNMTVASSCTLPLVGVAYAMTNSDLKFKEFFVHNSERIENEAFFKDNVLAHCKRDGLDIKFVGRIRCSDFRNMSKTVFISHTRFSTIKGAVLDCVWNGLPTVHNSPFLKDIGLGLERHYYDDNSVLGITNAFNAIQEDYTKMSGIFAPGRLEEIRQQITLRLAPGQVWEKVITNKVKVIKRELVVGFSDLWDDANHEYNFWTLLLQEAGKHMTPAVKVRGVKVSGPTDEIDVLIFGPFGNVWKSITKVPKFHITGENTPTVDGVMNFGFKEGPGCFRFPLWMQYIDWFGADQERLVNPKTMPIDSFMVTEDAVKAKNKFCAFVVSNPTNTVRNEAFQALNAYKPVDSAGRLFNTIGEDIFTNTGGGGGGELKKLEFLKKYIFCITYENNRSDGYVTEKLLAAKAAGCIPIYWGAMDVQKDFAEGSFLNVNTRNIVDAVSELEADPAALLAMATKPAFDIKTVRGKLSEVATIIFKSVFDEVSIPPVLGGSTTAEANAIGNMRGDITKGVQLMNVDAKAVSNQKLSKPVKEVKWNNKTLLVTFATQKYVEPLLKWLEVVAPRMKADSKITARVYIGKDVDVTTANLLQGQYPSVVFYRLPDIKVPNFPDVLEPQHFAWKLWIYQELVQEEDLLNTLVWYMDAASIIVRWPTEWFKKTLDEGICMLEDPEQKNDQWCQPSFRQRLMLTANELSQNQVVGGIMAFIGGTSLAWKVFTEAWVLGQQRELIVGPKWAGTLPDGRPCGHRHDQSILSIIRLRKKVPVFPLYQVYNHESLRRCYKSGAALYIHRGEYKEHENFANRIGEVHIINLARRQDRLKKFKDNHELWTKKVCLRPAYDGRALQLTPALAHLFNPNDFLWKKAIMGCALSHLSLWAELAAEQPCCENYLILEDDVKFQNGWMDIWAEASKHIPEDYDVLYLGGILPPNKEMFQKVVEPVNSFWGRIGPNQIFGQREPTSYFHFCNYSYIISRKGAQKILDMIQQRGGYYTSADHMVCNRIDMKLYTLNTLVAGCYQDDDPKYKASEFNNFNRVDAFDSDLWNNDDRFTEKEITTNLVGNYKNSPIHDALIDGRKVLTDSPNRIFTVTGHKLVKGSLFEYDWLNMLLGKLDGQQEINIDHEPLNNEPIFICMRPHLNEYMEIFSRYKASGKSFYAIHISDEHCNDPIEWYSACKHVYRSYVRPDTIELSNVTHIPLGPYRFPVVEGPVPQKSIIWSFYGTGWNNREALLTPLKGIQPNSFMFYKNWADPNQLTAKAYTDILLKTVFMPCPPGNNMETFRFYEALEHGVIPLYVAEDGDAHFQFLSQHLPLLRIDSWEKCVSIMINFLQKQDTLNEYRMCLLKAWASWKTELVTSISSI